jgi:predicted kinase
MTNLKRRLIMTLGLPGSGKTTWAKGVVDACPAGSVVRINKDDMRAMFHNGAWNGNKTERFIIAAQTCLVEEASAFDRVHTIIIDDTGFGHEERLSALAAQNGFDFEIKDFTDVPKAVCIERDLKRPNSVGQKVINKMALKYLTKPFEAPIFDATLPTCIIVDIDGTLAHMAGRSPYDYTKVHEDAVDTVVRGVVHAWVDSTPGDTAVFIVSGRKDECYDLTLGWLKQHEIWFDDLLMRKSDDDRDDTIVKGEIYEEHIAGKFNVAFVLDDRQKVVDMWRSRGLKCLQVAEGDF